MYIYKVYIQRCLHNIVLGKNYDIVLRNHFVFRSLAKNAKVFAVFAKFRFNLFRKKCKKFRENNRNFT